MRFRAILFTASLAAASLKAAAGGPFSYSQWLRHPAIVTWNGVGTSATTLDVSSSSSAKFVAFDNSSGAWADNPSRTWVSTADSSAIPGYIGTAPFWHAFAYGTTGYVGPGLVLRFKANSGSIAGCLDGGFTSFALGGLIVESGATGYSIGDTGVTALRHMTIGDRMYAGETYFNVCEDFAIRRGASTASSNTLAGAVNVYVASGKVFDLNSGNPQSTLNLSAEVPTVLRMSGDGKITNATLVATGPVTLDFSALSQGRKPFISGSLVVDKSTRLRLPSWLGENTSYQLCGGALSADMASGIRAITVGDETFFAEVQYNVTTKSVRYSKTSEVLSVNRATIDYDTSWSALKWESDFVPGDPIELTVASQDVRLTFDVDVDLGAIAIKGEHELSLVLKRNHAFSDIVCEPEATYAIVYPENGNQDVTQSLTVGIGEKFVIEGGATDAGLRTWQGKIQVNGCLMTRGVVTLANANNVVYRSGKLEADGGRLHFNSSAGALRGSLTIGKGAVFTAGCSGSLPDSSTYGSRIEVLGELDLSSNRWVLVAQSSLRLYSGGSIVGNGDAYGALDFYGLTNLTVVAVDGSDSATISAPIRYRSNIAFQIGDDITLNLTATNSVNTSGYKVALSGEGALNLVSGAEIELDPTSYCTGGISGAGTVVFSSQLPPVAARGFFRDSETWSGTVRLKGVAFSAFNPDDVGSFASKVSFLGCTGYFATNEVGELESQTKIELSSPTATYPIALTVVNGYEGAVIQLSRLMGSGKIAMTGSALSRGVRLLIPDVSDYSGSITIANSSAGMIFGLTLDEYAEDVEFNGRITLASGTATISSNAIWIATSGIQLNGGTVLTDYGEVKSPIHGSGTVRYVGSVPSSRPETAACFNQSTWTGIVRFENALLNNCSLSSCGNPDSVILMNNSSGQLAAKKVDSELRLEGSGFTVTGAVASATVEITRVTGSGAFTVDAGSTAAGAAYRFYNVSEFTGSFDVQAGTVSVLLGESAVRGDCDGAIVVADGFAMPVNREWSADRVYFNGAVTVQGTLGDTVLYATGDETCTFDHVTPTVTGGDPARRYSLDFDPDSRAIYVATAPVPPTMTVSDVAVDYGIDFTNVSVSVAIEDFWEGFDYDGGLLAELIVRDGAGEIVASGSVEVTGDGVYDFGSFELPDGQGGDFSYEVTVSCRETEYGRSEDVGGRGSVSQGVRLAGKWFFEDEASFRATKVASKTGTWTWPGATPLAFVSNALIRIETESSDGSVVDFTPYQTATSDVVKVEMETVFEDIYFADTYTLPDDLMAAVTLLADGEDSCALAVWDPAVSNLVKVFGGPSAVPVPGDTNLITVTFNYRDGYLSYSMDGALLTNSEGVSHFAMTEAQKSERAANVVEVGGKGFFKTLSGDNYNGNLASFDGTEYETVDEAVEAAVKAGRNDLTLLWDATWRPNQEDFGKTFTFDLDGHQLVVDPKSVVTLEQGGYRVIDNGDNTYTIGVIDYYIAFSAKDASSGAMLPQPYSITNMVFALASNRFIRAGFDFKNWNEAENGGAREWSNGETIDMSEFGLTNITLYAQWKIAARTITVEPADEYVYLEQVLTNGAENAGARFFRTDAATARGRAEIPVEHGSDVTLVFSTDIERALTYTTTNLYSISSSETLAYAGLPKVVVDTSLPASLLSAMANWADRRGISRAELSASSYGLSSSLLNTTSLLDEKSVVTIGDFKVIDGGCQFTVSVNGVALNESPKVASMVWLSDQPGTGWEQAPAESVSVTETGVVTVMTGTSGKFIKLVIPQN